MTHRLVIAGERGVIVFDAELRSDGETHFKRCDSPTGALLLLHQAINALPLDAPRGDTRTTSGEDAA